ncbi:Antitoxin [Candidatus Magnetomoraceae bacterium gMMP-15]
MKNSIEAIYESGVFKPLHQPDLSDGQHVRIIVTLSKNNLNKLNKKKYKLPSNQEVIYHDMDHLFGRWSEKEFAQIQGKIDLERKIDKELWE